MYIRTLVSEWNEKEIAVARSIFEKMLTTMKEDKYVPHEIYELHARTKLNVTTEMVVFNEAGQIYLIQRPSLATHPAEPYPDQFHSPGVTHIANESIDQAYERLMRSELTGVKMIAHQRVEVSNYTAPPRGMYLCIIEVMVIKEAPKNDRGRFYAINEIYNLDLVSAHRTHVLPIAIDFAQVHKII